MSNNTEDHDPGVLESDSKHDMEAGESSCMAQQPATRYRDAHYYFKIVVFQVSS